VFVGMLAGGLNAGLYGGSFDDIMKGAIIGGISGALFQAAGQIGDGGIGTNLAVGTAGGISSYVQTGNFWSGFGASFSASLLAPLGRMYPGTGYHAAFAAVAGGIGSSLSGGSFENGAVTGAFAALFSEVGGQARSNTLSSKLSKEDMALLKSAVVAEHALDPDFDARFLDTLDSVKVINGRFVFFQGDGTIMAPDGNIYWPGFSGEGRLSNGDFATLTHEIEHVYQFSQGENVLVKGLWTHTSNSYPYVLDLNAPYSSYSIEQRGESMLYNLFKGAFRPVNPSTPSIVCEPARGFCPR
jgi:hypothetical protein